RWSLHGRRRGAERSGRQSHSLGGGDPRTAVAGVVPVAARHVGEPADLCARREGTVGDQTAAGPRDPYARLAAATRRVWRKLGLPAGAESRRAWPGGRA